MNTFDLTAEQEKALQAVLHLAYTCNYSADYAHQTARFALQWFDDMQTLHNQNEEARLWLHYAAILHDIGVIEGWRGHHKASLRIILNASNLPFSNRERLIIGSIARYHRKSLPNMKHDHFAALMSKDQDIVQKLAAILRPTSELCMKFGNQVKAVQCKIKNKTIILTCHAHPPLPKGAQAELQFGDLLEITYNRQLVVRWKHSD